MEKLTPIYDLAHEFSEATAESIFLTGKAGTGKTTFLKNLRNNTRKQIAITAPTGVAAINAEGVTLHSFFQLPFTPFVPTPAGRHNLLEKAKISGIKRKIYRELDILVIDEISMVRADILDAIDTILRHHRFRPNDPFGGVQVIYIGDLYQLPPVALSEEWKVLEPYYASPFFFHSQVVQQQQPIYVELDKIFRQKNADFIRLLNEVRNNKLTEYGFNLLKSRYQPDFKLEDHEDYIVLTTHNAKANSINSEEMSKISGKIHQFKATIKGDFPERNYPNDAVLELKVGAKVMFIANDNNYPRLYFNGKIGVITEIDELGIHVACEDVDEILVSLEVWRNIRYTVNKTNGQIEEEELGSFTQFPLRLAWAITIHKSQGLTFDKAIIDAESAFSSGQVYVALSRCRSLEGIALTSPIYRESLEINKCVVKYAENKLPTDTLTQKLNSAKLKYTEHLLESVFDFKFAIGLLNSLLSLAKKNSKSINEEGKNHIKKLHQSAQDLKTVADKFIIQLQYLSQQHNPVKIEERITAASDYFVTQLKEIIITSTHSPAEIYNSEVAKEYKETLKMIFTELSLKKHLIAGIKNDFSIEKYHQLKDNFKIPRFTIKFQDPFMQEDANKMPNDYPNVRKNSVGKIPSPNLTLELYQKGMSVEEMMETRKLAQATVEGHLLKFIATGEVARSFFIDDEQAELVIKLLDLGETTGAIFSAMEGNLTYNQIRAVKLLWEATKE